MKGKLIILQMAILKFEYKYIILHSSQAQGIIIPYKRIYWRVDLLASRIFGDLFKKQCRHHFNLVKWEIN